MSDSTTRGARLCSINRIGIDVMGMAANERRLAARNSRWQVYFDSLTDEKGNEVSDYLVLVGHQARADHITGIAVLPVLSDKFVLVRVYRHPLGKELWEAPRGFVDADETAAEAALRELAEETGLRSAPANLVALGSYAPEPATMAARAMLFAALACEGVPRAANDELGPRATVVVDRAQMAELTVSGEIEDAGTLLLYYRFCNLWR